MNITEHFEGNKTVADMLVSFMNAVEEWQSQIEGTPLEGDLLELDKIYTIAEVELRFIINNDHSPEDDTQGTDLPTDNLKPASGDSEAQSGAGEKGRL